MNIDKLLKEFKNKPIHFNVKISKRNAVGYCHHKKHIGNLNEKKLKEHNCIEKECPYLEKYEDNKYWIKKKFKNPLKHYHKNSGRGGIKIAEKVYKTDDLDKLIVIYKNYLNDYGVHPVVEYLPASKIFNKDISNMKEVEIIADDVFPLEKDALNAVNEKGKELIEKYKSEIKNIGDLLDFPLNHCLCGDECIDYDAVTAYKIRWMELMGPDTNPKI